MESKSNKYIECRIFSFTSSLFFLSNHSQTIFFLFRSKWHIIHIDLCVFSGWGFRITFDTTEGMCSSRGNIPRKRLLSPAGGLPSSEQPFPRPADSRGQHAAALLRHPQQAGVHEAAAQGGSKPKHRKQQWQDSSGHCQWKELQAAGRHGIGLFFLCG